MAYTTKSGRTVNKPNFYKPEEICHDDFKPCEHDKGHFDESDKTFTNQAVYRKYEFDNASLSSISSEGSEHTEDVLHSTTLSLSELSVTGGVNKDDDMSQSSYESSFVDKDDDHLDSSVEYTPSSSSETETDSADLEYIVDEKSEESEESD